MNPEAKGGFASSAEPSIRAIRTAGQGRPQLVVIPAQRLGCGQGAQSAPDGGLPTPAA